MPNCMMARSAKALLALNCHGVHAHDCSRTLNGVGLWDVSSIAILRSDGPMPGRGAGSVMQVRNDDGDGPAACSRKL